MEVKPGYKQTEVGVIPEDWEAVTVGSLGSFTSGCGISVAALCPQSSDHPIPVFGGNGIAGYTKRAIVSEPTVVVGRVGQRCGEVYLTDGPAWITDNALYPRAIRRELDVRFLGMALAAADLNDVKNRNDLPLVTQTILHAVCVPWPPDTGEQRAIASALSDVDGLLGGLDRLIAKKRDLKRAAMQQLLTGQTQLPGFHGEWEIASLEQLVVKTTGVWGAQSYDEGHPRYADIIRAGDISPNGELTATAPRYLSEAEFAKARCQPDDLVITTSGNGLGKVWWCDGRANVAASNFVRVLRPIKSKARGRFLSYVLQSGEALRQLREHTATSAYPNLRPTFFSASWISLPSVPEQAAIAEVLTDMDAELAALEQRREKTRALKQAMMQELLTGRTRLV